MDNSGPPLILCVDDEPQVLAGLAVNLRRRYRVATATSAAIGLHELATHPDTAVVVSDMRMPVMDGATFLSKAREVAPEAVRILLTGQSDVESAIAAVNQGRVFRFLTKPCPIVTLLSSIQDAVAQHRLITAERVLLEQTLRGVIQTLTDVLALTNPVSFGRASRVKAKVTELAAKLEVPDAWKVEVAAMLSQLGYIVLAPETADKVYRGKTLSDEDAAAVARVPEITEQLLSNIPRLETIRGMLADYPHQFRRPTPDEADGPMPEILRGAHLLRAAIDFDALETAHHSSSTALEVMHARAEQYDPDVLALLDSMIGSEGTHDCHEVMLADLEVGMVFADDVQMDGRALLVARGHKVTRSMVERMRNVPKGTVKEPVRVLVPRSQAPKPPQPEPAADAASVDPEPAPAAIT